MNLLSFGQKKEEARSSIKVIANVQKTSITLRWAPSTAMAWQYANKYGYMVERVTIAKKGKVLNNPSKIVMTPSPITPLPMKDWENLIEKDKYAAIGAQALYSKSFQMEEKPHNFFHFLKKAEELENRFSFAMFCANQSLDVANYMGLKITDKFLLYGDKYLYKVYSPIPHNLYPIDTGYIFIEADNLSELPQPTQLNVEFGNRTAKISWNKVYYENIYSSYFIERSEDGKIFKRVNEDPFVVNHKGKSFTNKAYYIDSLPENYKKYSYRVVGKSFFGEYSKPSVEIEGHGLDIHIFSPEIISGHLLDSSKALLKWSIPSKDNASIKGFRIAVSESIHGKYDNIGKGIIPADKREFVIDKLRNSNYFIIKVIDERGIEYKSPPYLVQLKDSHPPKAPHGVKADVDTNGIVKITWKKNKEHDLIGYKVYSAQHHHEEFAQLTKGHIRDTIFLDSVSIKTLSKKIFYKVVAVDNHFNASSFSEIHKVTKPDKIPPVHPSFTRVISNEKHIHLQWKHSSSEDVAKHIILRALAGSEQWEELEAFGDTKINTFKDSLVGKGITYEYAIVAEDSSKNKSKKMATVRARLYDDGQRPEIKHVKVKVDRTSKSIILSWDYAFYGVDKFFIYRSEDGQSLRLYKTIPAEEMEFKDESLTINTSYIYQIRAQYKDGASSPMTKEIKVNY